jgi:hypothetical protein
MYQLSVGDLHSDGGPPCLNHLLLQLVHINRAPGQMLRKSKGKEVSETQREPEKHM